MSISIAQIIDQLSLIDDFEDIDENTPVYFAKYSPNTGYSKVQGLPYIAYVLTENLNEESVDFILTESEIEDHSLYTKVLIIN